MRRIINIDNEAVLSLSNRQLEIKLLNNYGEYMIPIEDIMVLMISNPSSRISSGAVRVLGEENVPVVFCGNNYHPVSICLPLEGNTLVSKRIKIQVECPEPARKQAWQQTIIAKIVNQASLVDLIGKDSKAITKYKTRVLSDDKDNAEAKAAREYWKVIFEDGFARDRFGKWPNPALNYTYAVFRAVMARAVVGTGLNPSLGIHHRNQYNAFCLVDDFIEPYRPFADLVVLSLLKEDSFVEHIQSDEMTKEVRKYLLGSLNMTVKLGGKEYLLNSAMEVTADSYLNLISGKAKRIRYPEVL
jgi:CRISPR-associated protein Cas1